MSLSATQAHALLNILSHHATYAEIEAFKTSTAIARYGPPFQPSQAKPLHSSDTQPFPDALDTSKRRNSADGPDSADPNAPADDDDDFEDAQESLVQDPQKVALDSQTSAARPAARPAANEPSAKLSLAEKSSDLKSTNQTSADPDSIASDTPILQTLLCRCLLMLPGLRDVKPSFWPDRVGPILTALADANLSESYDKSAVGQRRTVTTAIAALLEYMARGIFAGCPRSPDLEINPTSAEELRPPTSKFLERPSFESPARSSLESRGKYSEKSLATNENDSPRQSGDESGQKTSKKTSRMGRFKTKSRSPRPVVTRKATNPVRTEVDVFGQNYRPEDPNDAARAWQDALQQGVYGDLVDVIATRTAETDQLCEHPALVQAAHNYILLNVASLMHYTLIVSPRGASLLSLLEASHRLIPYGLIRQTFRVGNAATMMAAMVRIGLAKASVGALTNWLGVSQDANEGMNLMQTIISTVLNWDVKKLKSRVVQIEKSKDAPTKEQLRMLREYTLKSRVEQEVIRARSASHLISIITAILDEPLPPTEHALALDFLALILAIRDREQLIAVLCRQTPDLLTPLARDLVAAYEPVIRAIHNAVDLSGSTTDFQNFVDDMIQLSKLSPGQATSSVTVNDFVQLLRKHQTSLHHFLHQLAQNGTEISETYLDYIHRLAAQFRSPGSSPDPSARGRASKLAGSDKSRTDIGGAGALTGDLNEIVATLSDADRKVVLREIDQHATYLAVLAEASAKRTAELLSTGHSTQYGPGMYLARWQALLDSTAITPADAAGPVRRGGQADVQSAARVDTDGQCKGEKDVRDTKLVGGEGEGEGEAEGDKKQLNAGQDDDDAVNQAPVPPDMTETIRLLQQPFHELLQRQSIQH